MRTVPGRSALALLALSSALPGRAAPPQGEMRGLWVVRTALVSPQAVDQVVDDAGQAGFNALFVQVRGRGDAFYKSRLAARSSLLERQPREFDPFARLLARARARRIQVHAWVNVLLAAHFGQPLPPGHVLEKHPEWAMVPKSVATAALVSSGARRLRLIMEAGRAEGDVEGYYLSPSIPAVASHLESVVRELVRAYPVDGLHLDFVRYPGPSFDYSRSALEGFRRVSGGNDLLGGPGRDPSAWDEYQRQVLTALVVRLSGAARAERSGIVLSAAVTPDEAQAVHHRFQDWPRWLSMGAISALCPMTYTPDNDLFRQQVEAATGRARAGQPVWAGIGAYRLDVPGIVEKVVLARQAGAQGVVIFSHESLVPADLRRLREEAFAPRAVGDAARGGAFLAGSR
ncbi:MAG TPA: family 10 glycosylhydrolase [Vicinamibacteria bacterium]|nr:family 10 glycosylhydrolase [Vicinamibacteria bacterium]